MEELKALPATEGYAGIKSSTGKITPPVTIKGVALKDLAEFIGGMDETTGFNVVAEDGYSITFSYDQIQNGSFIAYDPATGDELKNPVELTAILAYEVDGKPFDPKQDGTLRLAIVSPELNQVTDGHWSVKWVNKLEVKSLGDEWILHAMAASTKTIDRASIESCGAPQCHGATWTDDKAQEWVGVPLYIWSARWMMRSSTKVPPSTTLADAGYTVDVIATDGYTVTFDAARVQITMNIIVAYKVNDNPLPDEYFPLRLVGADLQKNEMVGMIAEIKVDVPRRGDCCHRAPTQAAAAAQQMLQSYRKPCHHRRGEQAAGLQRSRFARNGSAQGICRNQERQAGLRRCVPECPARSGGRQGWRDDTGRHGLGWLLRVKSTGGCARLSECLLAFTDTPEKFKLVLPDLPSETWVKDVVKIEVK